MCAHLHARAQGSSSDVVKLAMVRTVAALRSAGIRGRLLSMVHDELVFEVEAAAAERAAGVVQAAMEAAGRLGRNAIGVQLKVMGSGRGGRGGQVPGSSHGIAAVSAHPLPAIRCRRVPLP